MDEQTVLLHLPKELRHRLKIQAVTERKTLSEMVSEAVAELLATKEKKT
jgi:hypothetical protein